ncbi:unnamed protein product [Urochloa decumbens]|uniref:Fungal lipase-type domain-containing protein n=1 Tax=Urochloa decumbens TaxID=240449 RepID=A0ABC9CCS4_9POAL
MHVHTHRTRPPPMAFTATLFRPRCTLQLPTSPRLRPNARPTVAAPLPPVAAMWRQVHGSGDWDGLLRPLHPVLRGEVARYGALVGACYDALDMDRSSPGYMRCKDRMLHETLAAAAAAGGAAGYEVTRYIYAAPDVAIVPPPVAPAGAAWVGYVAVSTDEMTRRLGRRDVLVAFRGTVTPAEWTANLMSLLRPARLGGDPRRSDDDVKVESGFLNLYTSPAAGTGGAGAAAASCREQLLGEVSRLVASCSSTGADDEISVTLAGHSMGGALALLLGYDLAELGLLNRRGGAGRSRRIPVSVLSFGAPRVGNAAFKARCDALGVKALRVANVRDPVTRLPGALLNERTRRLLGGGAGAWCYVHVGVELALDFASLRDLGSVHDLGAYVSCLVAQGGAQRRHRHQGAREAAASGGAAWRGDRPQLAALGFLLFLYGSLHHHWPLIINPLLITLFSNLSY